MAVTAVRTAVQTQIYCLWTEPSTRRVSSSRARLVVGKKSIRERHIRWQIWHSKLLMRDGPDLHRSCLDSSFWMRHISTFPLLTCTRSTSPLTNKPHVVLATQSANGATPNTLARFERGHFQAEQREGKSEGREGGSKGVENGKNTLPRIHFWLQPWSFIMAVIFDILNVIATCTFLRRVSKSAVLYLVPESRKNATTAPGGVGCSFCWSALYAVATVLCPTVPG